MSVSGAGFKASHLLWVFLCFFCVCVSVCRGLSMKQATLTQPLSVSRRSGLFAAMPGIPPSTVLFCWLLKNYAHP